MALNALGRLEVVFSFQDQSRRGTDSAKSNVQNLSNHVQQEGKKMQNAFSGAFPALLTVGLMRQMAAGVVALTKPANELQTSLRKMETFSGQTPQQFREFADSTLPLINRLGLITATSAPALIDAMTELQKKGISDTGDAFRALVPAATLAKLSGESVAEAVDAASVVYTVMGERGADLTFRLNQLAVAANASRINFSELTTMVARSGQAVAIAKPLFADMLFVIAQTRDIAPSMPIAATQVRRAYEVFSQKSAEVAQVLGVSVRTSEGHLRDFSEIMVEVFERGGDLRSTMTELNTVFGTRAFAPLAGIALSIQKAMKKAAEEGRNWKDVFFELRRNLDQADDKVNEMFTTMAQDNPSIIFERLGVAFEQLASAGGGALLNSLVQVADRVTSIVVGVTHLIDMFASAKNSVTSFVPGLGATADIFGRLLTSLVLVIGAFGMARGAWMLFGNVVKFSLGPLLSTTSMLTASTAATTANSAATTVAATRVGIFTMAQRAMIATSAAARGALAGLTAGTFSFGGALSFVGRSAIFLSRALGPVALVIGAVSLLMTAFDGFDDNVNDLSKLVMAGQKGRTADEVRKAADHFGDKLAAAAKRWEEMFKEEPAVLKTSTFTKMGPAVERFLSALDPTQAAKLGPHLRETVAEVQSRFAEIQKLSLEGEEISADKILDFSNGLGTVTAMLQKHGLVGNEAAAKMSKELMTAQKALLTFNKSTEDRVKILDHLTNQSGMGPTFMHEGAATVQQRTAVEEEASNKFDSAARLEQRLESLARMRAELPTGIMGQIMQDIFGPKVATQEEVNSAKQQIIAENPSLERHLIRVESAIEKQTRMLGSGINVKVDTGSGLNNAVNEAASSAGERSLNPFSGR